MQFSTEQAERQHLSDISASIAFALEEIDRGIENYVQEIQAQKDYIWQHKADMDGAEKSSNRTDVESAISLGDMAVKQRERLKRMQMCPYFGRVDFDLTQGQKEAVPFYIGVHTFKDPQGTDLLIHDWRAPVSSLYYDFETGPACYLAPQGSMEGEITAKRQYKIQNGELLYMLESSLNIGDDILQKELSQSAGEKMKNIVATIQREQNAVIRNESARILILQGVAGSGKTSIALHRAAFLLYRYKETLSSDNVMILSPNKVFGDYIANVLPELGEEQIAETDFEAIATSFLKPLVKFETFAQQVARLLEQYEEDYAARIRDKARVEFVAELDAYLDALPEKMEFQDLELCGISLTAQWLKERFDTMPSTPIFDRLDTLAKGALYQMKLRFQDEEIKWLPAYATKLRNAVKAMFPYQTPLAVYEGFYAANPERFQLAGKKKLEYCDVFPLLYTLLQTRRQEGYGEIRHLIVDEMQDYTPIQYAVLRKLFSCNMTILGDSNQSVNPFSSTSVKEIGEIFPEAEKLALCKSYRSTMEITEFAQNISRNDALEPVERHSTPPSVVSCGSLEKQADRIVELVSGKESVGIVCKTGKQAKKLYQMLASRGLELHLLDADTTDFSSGILITSAHLAKGLEFDFVIVPQAEDQNYHSEMDRSMLYIACTRAMHDLVLLYDKKPSHFVLRG